jgi:vacuolar-type H+-ATPase subunit I/STV1
MKILDKMGNEHSTIEECLAAEKKYDEEVAAKKAAEEKAIAERKAKEQALTAERKERANEVEAAYKASLEAAKHYHELLNKFVEDYGSFHMTLRTGDFNPFDGFEHFFDHFWL